MANKTYSYWLPNGIRVVTGEKLSWDNEGTAYSNKAVISKREDKPTVVVDAIINRLTGYISATNNDPDWGHLFT